MYLSLLLSIVGSLSAILVVLVCCTKKSKKPKIVVEESATTTLASKEVQLTKLTDPSEAAVSKVLIDSTVQFDEAIDSQKTGVNAFTLSSPSKCPTVSPVQLNPERYRLISGASRIKGYNIGKDSVNVNDVGSKNVRSPNTATNQEYLIVSQMPKVSTVRNIKDTKTTGNQYLSVVPDCKKATHLHNTTVAQFASVFADGKKTTLHRYEKIEGSANTKCVSAPVFRKTTISKMTLPVPVPVENPRPFQSVSPQLQSVSKAARPVAYLTQIPLSTAAARPNKAALQKSSVFI